VQVTCDIAPTAVADRTNVKNGDLVNFVIKERNVSTRVASHTGLFGGVGAGFQMLNGDLGSYGYFFDWARPKDLQSGADALAEWYEIRSREVSYSYFSTYTVGAGQFTMSAQLSKLDQLDGQAANDLTEVQINSAPLPRGFLRQWTLWPTPASVKSSRSDGDSNEGPDRSPACALETTPQSRAELQRLGGIQRPRCDVVPGLLVRLPSLGGQNFVWPHFSARTRTAPGAASRSRVSINRSDRSPKARPLSRCDRHKPIWN
jgi:hypothetical protein